MSGAFITLVFLPWAEASCCQPQHHPSEQHEQTQCSPHLNGASCGKESLIILDFYPLPLEFLPDLPAFLFLPASMFSLPRVLCCSNPLLEEWILQCRDVSRLAASMWYLWMCGLMDWWRNVTITAEFCLPVFVVTVVMVSPPFQAVRFWRIHKNSVCLSNFFGQHEPKIMEGKNTQLY